MSYPPTKRPPYSGSEPKLVISIDIGTTFSGTSWVYLDPNLSPHIWDVSSYEGQRHHGASTKVPTVLYYDSNGEVKAAGGETLDTQVIAEAEKQKWTRVEWFKILLCPDDIAKVLNKAPKTEMPRKKKVLHVISDFLKYMAKQARKDFYEKTDRAEFVWQQVENRIEYVLCHPNGWNTFQHSIMREAAHLANLVPSLDEAEERITFVSEGEASLHWCMDRGLGRKELKTGNHYIVVDAGGGTIDISSFKAKSTLPLTFEESSAPDCHLEGAVFITESFKRFVQDKLNSKGGSAYSDSDSINQMVKDFDEVAKCNFRSIGQDPLVTFGGRRDHDPEFNIASGRLQVRGPEMVQFYEAACRAIVKSVQDQIVPHTNTTVMLVGGLAGNDYLFKELDNRLSGLNIQLRRAKNDATAKAAANGAICFYLDRSVSARVAKLSYGVTCVRNFEPNNPRHVRRRSRVETNPVTGEQFIDGGFFITLKKDTVVQETELTKFPFYHIQPQRSSTTIEVILECYRGDATDIIFRDESHEGLFRELCSFKALIPETALSPRPKRRRPIFSLFTATQYYYVCNFHIVVSFGATEFKCFIEWTDEKGVTQSGPITPVWDQG